MMNFPSLNICTLDLVNGSVQPLTHRFPIERREPVLRLLKIQLVCAFLDN